MGIVAGRDNTAGILGIAPRVDSVEVASHHSAGKNGLVASAIQKVLPFMKAGDVLLIEEQEGLNDPAEIKDETFGAISKAISAGIIVIEPAGNGNKNLDSRNTLNPAHPKFQDSGAIVVAACNRPDARGNGRTRWVLEPSDVRLAGDFPRLLPPCKAPDQPPVFPDEQPELVPGSNFGARVDCYAWGEGIVSAGYGWLEGTRGTNSYTNGFGGTSGAAAIVAGAAVLVQGLHKHAKGRPLTPAEMRDALRANGTPQQPAGATARIGVMPDVRKIANALNL